MSGIYPWNETVDSLGGMQPSVQVKGLVSFPLPNNVMRPRRVNKTHFISHCLCSNSLSPAPTTSHVLRALYDHGMVYVILMVGEQEGYPFGLVLGIRQSDILPWGKAGPPASPS